jgi:hypothetical protein
VARHGKGQRAPHILFDESQGQIDRSRHSGHTCGNRRLFAERRRISGETRTLRWRETDSKPRSPGCGELNSRADYAERPEGVRTNFGAGAAFIPAVLLSLPFHRAGTASAWAPCGVASPGSFSARSQSRSCKKSAIIIGLVFSLEPSSTSF